MIKLPHIVIIGAGFGGLAAAVKLAGNYAAIIQYGRFQFIGRGEN